MKLNANTIVKLLQVKGIGRGKIFKLSDLLNYSPSDNKDLADALLENALKLSISNITLNEILDSFTKGEELFYKSEDFGINIIGFWDSNFPPLLKEIQVPPVLINVRGDVNNLTNMPCAAIIGTREPSNYGRSAGERLGYRLGENGINVISGLAKGCDSAAHIGCIKANGITTAILAHGLDYIYPKENIELSNKILETNGCLLSEYLIKTRAQPSFFVERDRLQSGLSVATIVVETAISGGTMHAVKATIDSKKILAAFNHPFDKRNEKSKGNEMLINEKKAIGLQSKDDIDNLILRINPTLTTIVDAAPKPSVEKNEPTQQDDTITKSVSDPTTSPPPLILETTPIVTKKGVVKKKATTVKHISEEEQQALVKYEQTTEAAKHTKEELKRAKEADQIAVKAQKIAKAELDNIRKKQKNKIIQPELL